MHIAGPKGCFNGINPVERKEKEKERDLETKDMNIIGQDQIDRRKKGRGKNIDKNISCNVVFERAN